MQLDRSDGEPLRCNLDIERVEHFKHPYIRNTALRLLSSLNRCTDLDLGHIMSSIMDLSEELPSGTPSLPRIRNLIVRRWESFYHPLKSGFFSSMPALKDVIISPTYLLLHRHPVPEVFRSLTALKIHQCTTNPAQIVAMLFVAANLQRLCLHPAFPGRFHVNIDRLVIAQVAELPFLDYLDVHFYPVSQHGKVLPYGDPGAVDYIRQVVCHIRTPNLRDLRVNGPGREDVNAPQTCIECISDGTVCPVRKLAIIDPEADSLPQSPHLISRTPSLEYLQIFAQNTGTTTCDIDPLLDALRWTPCEVVSGVDGNRFRDHHQVRTGIHLHFGLLHGYSRQPKRRYDFHESCRSWA
ncbi:hypothetical protein BDV98DRAFT_223085 [Pterulicium gracile]|uniref:Uncharacterized protein n=1 Tax=Pterulicium gracile TaxID=1884261 RepID=A0A5C3QY90_9AGAR|nr:hypothetical protein BDV98DRAFT_223085 [Pterula gracilis]